MSDGTGMFSVPADAYERYMGLWSRPLARKFVAAVDVASGDRALDVGCGTGALTAELARKIGAEHVAAVDPSEPSVVACAATVPGADVRVGGAETLPFTDATFDVTLSQLVVNFMADAQAGVAEMRRVTRPGGTVAACTWDYRIGMTMLRVFWDAAVAVDPSAPHEGHVMPYVTPNDLERLWRDVGLVDVETGELVVRRSYADFDDFWEPFTFGVGPGGSYCVSLDPPQREALREECFRLLGSPVGTLELTARAWLVRGSSV
jgi:ubiquinone/menaquinone biosynthesis C-methylase UbiE